jgi:ASCH domain
MTMTQDTLFGEPAAPKAITIKQPWASLIMAGLKDVENRTWKTNFRGTLAIHAGSGIARDAMTQYGHLVGQYPAGAIIGTVELVACITDSPSPWAMEGHYHWILENPRPCAPVQAAGALSFWQVAEAAWVRTGLA